MSKQDLREQMPVIAAIVDDLREIFGKAMIDQQIRRAMQGEPTFWATESGLDLGTRHKTASLSIVAGRGIYWSVEVPNGEDPADWMRKVDIAMDKIAARLKAAANEQYSGSAPI